MWDPYSEFKKTTLSNGLTIHALHWPNRPWEAIGILVHSGAEHDPIGFEGLAHFVEHLTSENANTPKKEMNAYFEKHGGMVDFGATGYPYTHYRFFLPAEKTILAKAFSMFGHMLILAKLEDYIEREREIIINEFHCAYPAKFQFDLDMQKHKALYSDSWLGRFTRPLGNPESIKLITREELQSYHDTHYTPANISIVGVGGMTLSELAGVISESPFATSKKGSRTPLPLPTTAATLPSENRFVFERSNHIMMAKPIETGSYQSVAKIPGNVNIHVIKILSEMVREEVYEKVREQHAWSYSTGSSYRNFRHFYELSINCDTLFLQALEGIEKVIEDCITSIKNRKGSFERNKRCAIASNYMIDPTGKGICNDTLSDLANYQRIIPLKEYVHDIKRVTMVDVCDLLQWLKPEQRWTLIEKP